MNPMVNIKDKTVLITGANRGIGKSITECFLKNGAKKVYLAVRNTASVANTIEQYGDRVAAINIDLARPETIMLAADTTTDVEVVVNNAGILMNANALEPKAIQAMREQLDINVLGLMYIAQAFAPILKQNGGGAFVQLNSVASLRAFPDFATYAASKAAAYSITQALQAQLAEQGTAVLSVHPGPIQTDMASEAGLQDIADPPEMVAEGIISALANGDFHLFPDTMAQELWANYQGFAKNVIETTPAEE